MTTLDNMDVLFVVCALLFQIVLIVHFSLRKWRFSVAMEYGWLVYALSVPALGVSMILLLGGKPWSLWMGGVLYFIWAVFGYTVEYARGIEWRSPIRWSVFVPYIILYLATVMFYWWPLVPISRPLWFVAAVLFIITTLLNVTSHKRSI